MLKNIKSSNTIIKVFNIITEERKLNIVKYNKSLQNILNINIFNYALVKGKYIEYQSNGYVKIYDGISEYLVYEGEYLKGKKNGKGKDYSYNELVYEGEYLKGKKMGLEKNIGIIII